VHHTVAADVANRSLHLAYSSMMLTMRGKRPLPELQLYNLYFRLVYQYIILSHTTYNLRYRP